VGALCNGDVHLFACLFCFFVCMFICLLPRLKTKIGNALNQNRDYTYQTVLEYIQPKSCWLFFPSRLAISAFQLVLKHFAHYLWNMQKTPKTVEKPINCLISLTQQHICNHLVRPMTWIWSCYNGFYGVVAFNVPQTGKVKNVRQKWCENMQMCNICPLSLQFLTQQIMPHFEKPKPRT